MIVQHVGGPLDGHLVDCVIDVPPVRLVRVKDYPLGTFDTGTAEPPLWAMYVFDGDARYMFASLTDEEVKYVTLAVRCRACGAERLYVYPERAELPFKCPGCGLDTCWPMKLGGS